MQSKEQASVLIDFIKRSKIKVLVISLVIVLIVVIIALFFGSNDRGFYDVGYLVLGIVASILLFTLKDKYKSYHLHNLFDATLISKDENSCVLESDSIIVKVKDNSLMKFTDIALEKKFIVALNLRFSIDIDRDELLNRTEKEYKLKCWKLLGIFLLGLVLNGILTSFDYAWITKINLSILAFAFCFTYWLCISKQHKILRFHTNCSIPHFDKNKDCCDVSSEKIDLILKEKEHNILNRNAKNICFAVDVLDTAPASGRKFNFNRNCMFGLIIKN